jgi:hypothetical protein
MENKETSFVEFAGNMGIIFIFVAIFMYPFHRTGNAFWMILGMILTPTLGLAIFVCLCMGAGANPTKFEPFWALVGLWAGICLLMTGIEWLRKEATK